jgi:poly(A) polymerase
LATREALQRFELTRALFPVLKGKGKSGKAIVGELLDRALENTDERIKIGKPVTPAFLLAAIMWQPVRERADVLQSGGLNEHAALGQAADEVMSKQVQRTAIPRRFSVVTRQIWTMQPRFNNTHGRRAKSLLQERRFRAAYDFLLLTAEEDDSLQELCDHWTEAQKGVTLNTGQRRPGDSFRGDSRSRPRRRRRRRLASSTS